MFVSSPFSFNFYTAEWLESSFMIIYFLPMFFIYILLDVIELVFRSLQRREPISLDILRIAAF